MDGKNKMGTDCAKENKNVYFCARKEAATHNPALYARDRAAEMIGVSVSTLADYELGITKVVPVDKVVLMADLYNCPELKTGYCKHECPIGKTYPVKTKVGGLEGITLRLLNAFDKEKLKEMRNSLIEISSDGDVDDSEREEFQSILEGLDRIILAASELKLAGSKILSKRKSDG